VIARRGGALLLGLSLVVAGIGGGSATAAEAPGDATRGQAVFTARQCVRCHAVRDQPSVGPAIEELRRPQGAYELAGRF
jgi:cytochrome c2